ncbi:MAG TPA: nicotinate phosphoribosyltransferase [Polyangiaceae bacterium]|nr:nicotinate phosphoribosyltransferase [Polyangiaceae bacterium]
MTSREVSRPDRGSRIGLSTDLYEFSMGASYLALGMEGRATFSLLVRKLPKPRTFLVVAGIEQAVSRLTSLAFDAEDAAYLASTGYLSEQHARELAATRFTGDVWAVPEGRTVFADEPLLEVSAPIVEAQLVESLLLNAIHYPTLVASKAARCIAAAPGKVLVDFGLRRAPGIDAAIEAARCCYLAGFSSTSNVLAARELGIPVSGTVAHSFIETFSDETEAFRACAATAIGPVTLLVDTYDTISGVAKAIRVAKEMAALGLRVASVRLDSGDLDALSRRTRTLLDDAGLAEVKIFASGGLDETELAKLTAAGAPIDGYGVGTRLGMSADAPVLDLAYKIVAYDGRPCLKLSEGKATLIGPKQVWRRRGTDGLFSEDLVAARDEPAPGRDWEPLLEPVMRDGRPEALPSLDTIRLRHREEMAAMPPRLLEIGSNASYRVTHSAALLQRQKAAVEQVLRREGLPAA